MTLSGTIVRGEGWGRKLGYPTANLQKPTTKPMPLPDGVYAAWARVGLRGKWRRATLLVGAPTFFQARAKKLEVYFIKYSGNLYGKTVSVRTVKKIRPMKRFVNSGALIAQIEQDLKKAERILSHDTKTHPRKP